MGGEWSLGPRPRCLPALKRGAPPPAPLGLKLPLSTPAFSANPAFSAQAFLGDISTRQPVCPLGTGGPREPAGPSSLLPPGPWCPHGKRVTRGPRVEVQGTLSVSHRMLAPDGAGGAVTCRKGKRGTGRGSDLPKATSRLVGGISGKRNPRRGHTGGQTHRAVEGNGGVGGPAQGLAPLAPWQGHSCPPLPQATGSLMFL